MMRMNIHVSEVQFCLILPLEIGDSALKGRVEVLGTYVPNESSTPCELHGTQHTVIRPLEVRGSLCKVNS